MVAGATMLSNTSGRKSPKQIKEKNNKFHNSKSDKDTIPKNTNNINNINNIKQQNVKK
jgi:hypothetical protein